MKQIIYRQTKRGYRKNHQQKADSATRDRQNRYHNRVKKFKHIVVLGDAQLIPEAQANLQAYSGSPISYPKTNYPDEASRISVAHEADAIVVPWHIPITESFLAGCPKLKYIGITSTTLKGINLEAAKKRGITVTNVSHYGDDFVATFIFDQLSKLNIPLNGKMLGVIGPGAVGQAVILAGLERGMKVQYFGPSRKPAIEAHQVGYAPLANLLSTSDVITLHTPRDIRILGPQEFQRIREGATLVDTAIGDTIDDGTFRKWIQDLRNHAVFDLSIGQKRFEVYRELPNVIAAPLIAGFTPESNAIRCRKILENIESYLFEHQPYR
jgi:phosphoglycerate dehydrogenase-like enzyme